MATYKVVATITWQFESNTEANESLELAKSQLNQILNADPHGDDFESFSAHLALTKMKERKRLVHIGSFGLNDVFPYVTTEDSRRTYVVSGKEYSIKMNSERYHLFKASCQCVACGLVGTKFLLDKNPGDQTAHFNLYAEEKGRLVLMTKDHIVPKSKGGSDDLGNFNTMCSICNGLKAHHDLTNDQVGILRQLLNNENKLPRKDLRDLIEKHRIRFEEINGSTVRRKDDSSENSQLQVL